MCADTSKRKGLASFVEIKCTPCGYSIGDYSSSIIQKEGKGVKAFDVNTRSAYAMRSCGLGIIALEIYCGLMNLPAPIANNNFQKVSKKLRETARDVAESSMVSAVKLKKMKVHTSVCR